MSIKRRRLSMLCAAGSAAASVSLVASPAAAAAPLVPGGTLTVTGPGLGTFDAVTPPTGQGASFSPAFSAVTDGVFIPYEVSGTIVTSEGTFTFDDVKKAPVPSDAMTCTFEG